MTATTRLSWHEVTTKPIEIHHCTLSNGRKLQIDIEYGQKMTSLVATIRLLHPHWYQFETLQTFTLASPDLRTKKVKRSRQKYSNEMTPEELARYKASNYSSAVANTIILEEESIERDHSQEAYDQVREETKDVFEKLFLTCVDYCESLFGDIETAKEKADPIADLEKIMRLVKMTQEMTTPETEKITLSESEKASEKCGTPCGIGGCPDPCVKSQGHGDSDHYCLTGRDDPND